MFLVGIFVGGAGIGGVDGGDAMHMIDSTIIRAHHHAAGGNGGRV
jgi:hypothetical protein